MQRVRRTAPAALLAGALLLVGGCSKPAPADAPTRAATVASPATPAAPTSAASTPGPATPTGPARPTAATPTATGNGSVVPTRPVVTAPPKKLDEPARTAGAKVSLTSVQAVAIKAGSPGDRSGPGVLVRLKLDNTTGRAIDLSFVSVSVDASSAGKSATLVDGPPTRALAGSLKAGASTEGTYAFLLADARSTPITVAVYVTSGQPVVTFRGQAR